MLLGIAAGGALRLPGGTAVVPEGRGGFSNNLTQYDDISSGGAMFTDRDLTPFTVLADQLDVRFETGPHAFGAPREFTLHARYTEGGPLESATIQVNHPLQLSDGTQVHLLAHGYAPQITVRDGNGQVAWSGGPVVFVPEDGNFNSTGGVIKSPDARPERLAFEGRLLPTAVVDERGTRSAFPRCGEPGAVPDRVRRGAEGGVRGAGERLHPGQDRDAPAHPGPGDPADPPGQFLPVARRRIGLLRRSAALDPAAGLAHPPGDGCHPGRDRAGGARAVPVVVHPSAPVVGPCPRGRCRWGGTR